MQMKLCELLDDREWHKAEDLILELGKLIPPGQAIRRAELRRRLASGQRNEAPSERARPLSKDRQIAGGRRSYARDAFSGMRKYTETKFDDEGVEWMRMIELPARVKRDRARARAHFHFEPSDLADEIGAGADAPALIKELTPKQLTELALELARRERARQLSR